MHSWWKRWKIHVMSPAIDTTCLADAFPKETRRIYARRYEDVQNGGTLKSELISVSKSTDESARKRMDYAFVNGRMLTSRQHLLTACMQAIIASQRAGVGCKTPTVHSEILWVLSPGNNVGDALRRFGVATDTQSLVLVHICAAPQDGGPEPEQVAAAMDELVAGRPVDRVDGEYDWTAIRTIYKLKDAAVDTAAALDTVVCSIVATKYVA